MPETEPEQQPAPPLEDPHTVAASIAAAMPPDLQQMVDEIAQLTRLRDEKRAEQRTVMRSMMVDPTEESRCSRQVAKLTDEIDAATKRIAALRMATRIARSDYVQLTHRALLAHRAECGTTIQSLFASLRSELRKLQGIVDAGGSVGALGRPTIPPLPITETERAVASLMRADRGEVP